MKTVIIITVEKHPGKPGFQLKHNQGSGFKGIISNSFAWYKCKSEAIKRAEELMQCWN